MLSALLLRRALDGARPARVICASGLTGVCLAAMAWRCWTASNAWLSLEGLYQNVRGPAASSSQRCDIVVCPVSATKVIVMPYPPV